MDENECWRELGQQLRVDSVLRNQAASSSHRSSAGDEITIVAAGITLREALAAAEELAQEGVSARILDLYSVKPIDERTLVEAAEATGAILTVEDHHPEGGIGDAVLEVFADGPPRPQIVTLAVREMPTSGTPAELLEQAGIDREHIRRAAQAMIGARSGT